MGGVILGLLVLIGLITPEKKETWIVVAEKVGGAVLAVAAAPRGLMSVASGPRLCHNGSLLEGPDAWRP